MSAVLQRAVSVPTSSFTQIFEVPPNFPAINEYAIVVSTSGYVGWSVALQCSKLDANGKPIQFPPTLITQNVQLSGVPCSLASGFTASITVSLYQNGAPPAGPADQVELFASFITPGFFRKTGAVVKTGGFGTGRAAAAASTYPGFYFRTDANGNATVPNAGPFDLCPDIIASQTPIANAQAMLSTPASWSQSDLADPVYGKTSYYYVRGKNGGIDPVSDLPVSLYATPSELILFPSLWSGGTPMRTASGQRTVNVSAEPGAIGVGEDAFVFTPQQPDAQSDFYAFVAQATPTIPPVSTWEEMSALLTNELGIGFRNTLQVDPGATSWVHRVGLNVPADLEAPAMITLTLTSQGMTGGFVGLMSMGGTESISIAPQLMGGDVVAGTQLTLSPGFSASLIILYWNEDSTPAPGSTITLNAVVPLPQSSSSGIQPQLALPLGSMTFVFGN